MTETKRYVAYYRMPSVGDIPNGNTLARQRGEISAFLDTPVRILVGEFTEVMTPAHEGETSPAFDLSLDCCRNLDATLITAVPETQLGASAWQKEAREYIDIVVVGDRDLDIPNAGNDISAGKGQTAVEPVPYLRLGRGARQPPFGVRALSEQVPSPGNRAKADRFARAILPIIDQIRESGATTLIDIADALNARHIRTARGRRWYPTTVKNILDRRSRLGE